mmetsp:Transcript_29420/g.77101  ORF Transcript_29420/g.77101 Transcript_29420/m.77101 type:complete len:639 (+) Transcript_29420:195-2111(+)
MRTTVAAAAAPATASTADGEGGGEGEGSATGPDDAGAEAGPALDETQELTQVVAEAAAERSSADAWVIEVDVGTPEQPTVITVEIARPTERKRWLGGFRHKDNGCEYHNVSTQTYMRPRRPDGKIRFHREAQTKQVSSGATNNQQTSADSSTQMTRPGAHVSGDEDRIIAPRPYFSAAEWGQQREDAAIRIQSYYRRMAAKRYVDKVRKMKHEYDTWMAAEVERRRQEEEDEWQSQMQRRLNPKSKADFALLYSGLEVWRKEQLEGLSGLDGDERTEAMVGLLKKQCSYLSAVEKLKNAASDEMRDARIRKFFDKTSRPKRWVEKEYQKVNEMETPATLRARELREVYYGLAFEGLEMDERLDMLVHVKLTVQDFDSKVAREMIDLLSREADLLVRGTREKNMVGLRKRILSLFLRLCEDPAFNPAAKQVLPVHKEKKDYMVGNGAGLIRDMATGEFLESDQFLIRDPHHMPTQGVLSRTLVNEGIARKDTTQYRRILRTIQNDEIKRGAGTHGAAFRLLEADMVYLIDTIWGGKSAISQEPMLIRLSLPRWNSSDEWSPWNCVLMEHSEATNHEAANDASLYGEAFCKAVTIKQLRAKHYFYSVWEAQEKRIAEQAEADALAADNETIQFKRTGLVA